LLVIIYPQGFKYKGVYLFTGCAPGAPWLLVNNPVGLENIGGWLSTNCAPASQSLGNPVGFGKTMAVSDLRVLPRRVVITVRQPLLGAY